MSRNYLWLLLVLLLMTACEKRTNQSDTMSTPFPEGTSAAAQKAINDHLASQALDESGYILVDEHGHSASFVDMLNEIHPEVIEKIPAEQLLIMKEELTAQDIATLPLETQAALTKAFSAIGGQ